MKIKKISAFLSLLLAIVMLMSALVSCGNTGSGTDTSAADTSTADIAGSDESTAPESTVDPEVAARDEFYNNNFATGIISEDINPGVMALLSCCEYYNATMKAGTAAGQKWVYSNSSTYVPQAGTFDSMVEKAKYGANCASPVNWAFIDMGIMSKSLRFYGGSTGNFANYNAVIAFLDPVCEIFDRFDNPKEFKDLYAAGEVKAGDIFLCKHHTFIYRGDGTFFAAGHDGKWHTDPKANTEDDRKAVFEEWVLTFDECCNYTYTCYYQIRLKDNYIPQFYRNKEGALVENPMWSPEKSTTYDYQAHFCFDTFGKENVLLGTTFSHTENSFNIGKLSDKANLTDGQLYYDNTTMTYCDIKFTDMALRFNANGEKGSKSAGYKYIGGMYTVLDEVAKVDSFSLWQQATGASSGGYVGGIDGFDILVSLDGKEWTVVYSITEAACENKWKLVDDEKNRNMQGNMMCSYIMADFTTGPVDAKYIMLALTDGRCQHAGKLTRLGIDALTGSSAPFFRLSEFQVYAAEKKQ